MTIRSSRTETEFAIDEHPRATTMDDLARLKPALCQGWHRDPRQFLGNQ